MSLKHLACIYRLVRTSDLPLLKIDFLRQKHFLKKLQSNLMKPGMNTYQYMVFEIIKKDCNKKMKFLENHIKLVFLAKTVQI